LKRKLTNKKIKESLDLTSITKMVLNLFEHWSLNPEEQLILLGYKPTSSSTLARLRDGGAIPFNKDKIMRIDKLLLIHRALRMLYPYNLELCYSWVKRGNRVFDGETPLEIMLDGNEGLNKVWLYVGHLCQR
jgi:hypothetical protein